MEWNVKHLLLRKTDFLKTSISRKGNLKKCTNFEEQKVQGILGGMFIVALSSSAVFCLQNLVSDFF